MPLAVPIERCERADLPIRAILLRPAKLLLTPLFAGCWVLLALPVFLNAQSLPPGGTRVEGTVRDSSGASVPAAQVEVRSGAHSETKSLSPSGDFDFENVPGVSGTIIVTAKGFQKFEQAWNSSAGKQVHLEIVLVPLAGNQQIVVTG